MSIVAAVFARGGSRGVPRKNLRLLGDKPLIAYPLEIARQCPSIDRVVVSTDDAEIAEIAKTWGAEVPYMRPADLSTDTAPERAAWQHLVRWLQENGGIEALVSLSTTSPFRSVESVEACIGALLSSDADIVICVKHTDRNPFYNMVRLDADGSVRLAATPDEPIQNRQQAPVVFDMTTVAYAARPDYVLTSDYLFDGDVRAVVVPEVEGIDIDSELDLKYCEFVARELEGEQQLI